MKLNDNGTWGIILGLLGILVPVVMAIRSQRKRRIIIEPAVVRPFIDEEAGNPERLSISIGGQPVSRPWLYSARLRNSGQLPIIQDDLERPYALTFEGCNILTTEVQQAQSVEATTSSEGSIVFIQHKLLNPGEGFHFSILLDGPIVPPRFLARIRGGTAELKKQSSALDWFFPTLIRVPQPFIYLSLIISSLIALMLMLMGPFMVAGSIGNLNSLRFTLLRSFDEETQKLLGEGPRLDLLEDDNIRMQLRSWEDPPSWKLLDRQKAVIDMLSASNIETVDASRAFRMLRGQLVERLASGVYDKFPVGPDSIARNEILNLDFGADLTVAQYMDNVRARMMDIARRPDVIEGMWSVFAGSVVLAFLAFLGGASLVLVVGGTWRTIRANE